MWASRLGAGAGVGERVGTGVGVGAKIVTPRGPVLPPVGVLHLIVSVHVPAATPVTPRFAPLKLAMPVQPVALAPLPSQLLSETYVVCPMYSEMPLGVTIMR